MGDCSAASAGGLHGCKHLLVEGVRSARVCDAFPSGTLQPGDAAAVMQRDIPDDSGRSGAAVEAVGRGLETLDHDRRASPLRRELVRTVRHKDLSEGRFGNRVRG